MQMSVPVITSVDLSATAPPISDLNTIMKGEVANAAQFEQRLGALQDALTANLKEAQEIVMLYNRQKTLVKEHIASATQQTDLNVPMIRRATDKTLDVIHDVEWKLPGIMSQLMDVKRVYELGRARAQVLQTELEWTAKSDFERWRSTFLGKSPLSPQQVKREWKQLFKRLMLCGLLICTLVLYFVWRILSRTI